MRPLSLKARMSFTVMTLVLIILAGVASLAIYYFKHSFRQLITDQQVTLVGQLAANLDNRLNEARRLIAATAADFPLDRLANSDRAQWYLDTQLGLGTTSLYDNGIFLFTAEGILLAEYPFKPGRRGRDYSFRKYFQDTISSGQPQISDPYISSQTHQHPAVNFTAPIRDQRGEIAAVIAGSVDLTGKNFLGDLSRVRIGQTGYLYLYNTERLMIMHPDPQRIMKQDVPVGANIWFDRALAGFEGTAETVNSRGLRTLATFRRLNDKRWILAANYPTSEAYQPITTALHYLVIGLVTVLLLSLVVTWAVTRILLAPLARLERHVASFASDRAQQLPHGSLPGNEITTLAVTFERLMTDVSAQRRKADDRLAFLQGIMDTIPYPTFYKDLDGHLLGGNRALQTLCGKPLTELIGTTLHDHLPVDTAGQILVGDELLLQGETTVLTHEVTFFPQDGEQYYALLHKALLKDGLDHPQGIVCSLIDISERKAIELDLAREREFSLSLLEHSATPCFVIDANHKVLIWTRALEELTGLKAGAVLGTAEHWRGFYPEPRPCLADIVLDKAYEAAFDFYPVLANSPLIQDGLQSEGWFVMQNGRSRYLTFDAAPIHDRNGQLVAVIETMHDLTNLKAVENSLRETQESYHALVDSSPDAILVHRQGTVLYGNRAAAALFLAAAPQELTGRTIASLLHPGCQNDALERISEVEILKQENLYIEEKIVRFDGEMLQVEIGLSPTYYGGGWAVQSVLRDITLRMAEQERIWRQANFDALTGLPNRSLFMDRLEQALGRCDREHHPAGLMFLDLDHFKAVNDTLGHDNGDELLRQAAERMSRCLRQTDTLARLGGDEFTIILPVLSELRDLQLIASRLLLALSKPFKLSGGIGRISCSIGVAIYPQDAGSIDDLMCVADAAMYRVKQSGRNGFHLPQLETLPMQVTEL